jgi:glutathione S-transferase
LKLYNSNFAPSPRRVRIFLAEKGLSIPRIEVDLGNLEHKRSEFSALNPFHSHPRMAEMENPQIPDWGRPTG